MPSCLLCQLTRKFPRGSLAKSATLPQGTLSTVACLGTTSANLHSTPRRLLPDDNVPTEAYTSNRRLKRRRVSPSKPLLDALKSTNHSYPLPIPKLYKADLSYVNAHTAGKRLLARQRSQYHLKPQADWHEPVNLQSILAAYIKEDAREFPDRLARGEVNILSVHAMDTVFNDKVKQYMHTKSYNADDIQYWAAILTTKITTIATTRLIEADAVLGKPLPVPILLLFLQRNDIGPTSLRQLVTYAIARTQNGSSTLPLHNVRHVAMDETSLFIMIVRLLRHARKVLPPALVPIVAIAVKQLHHESSATIGQALAKSTTKLARIEGLYNRMLSLISRPTPPSPFHSTVYQESAQFDLLRRMAAHKPPLGVSREGYRAIVAVQLANKKTSQECDWASLKALSWPPWKEDKTGFDVEKGPEYGMSRASVAVSRMLEAGYGVNRWENVAKVLAGWDIDESPTIQTRSIHLHQAVAKRLTMPSHASVVDEDHKSLWAARIRATRSVQEAWAHFLSFGDMHLHPLQPHQDIYLAMFEKLHAEDQRRRKQEVHGGKIEKHFVGGDGREVMAVPTSPKEGVYVRTPAPTLAFLARQMHDSGIKPTGYCLAFLVSTAPGVSLGMRYLRWGCETDPDLESLLTGIPRADSSWTDIAPVIFNAWIQLLCRFPHRTFASRNQEPSRERLFQYALRLLGMAKPRYLPAWNTILSILIDSSRRIHLRPDGHDAVIADAIERFVLMQNTLQQLRSTGLEPDIATFTLMCQGLQNALFQALDLADDAREATHLPPAATQLLANGSAYICKLFYTLMGSTPISKPTTITTPTTATAPADTHADTAPLRNLPQLLAPPHGAALHALIRVLGMLPHWQGLVELLRWMAAHRAAIDAAAAAPRNGAALRRRALVAVRVFAERYWLCERGGSGSDDGLAGSDRARGGGDDSVTVRHAADGDAAGAAATAPAADRAAPMDRDVGRRRKRAQRRTLKKLRTLVDGVDGWGGWPSDEECAAYVRSGRFPRF